MLLLQRILLMKRPVTLLSSHSSHWSAISKRKQTLVKPRINYILRMEESSLIPNVEITFWSEYFKLSANGNVVNLGSYKPNDPPPRFILNTLKRVAESDDYSLFQYTRQYEYRKIAQNQKVLNMAMARTDLPPKFVLDALNDVTKSENPDIHQCTRSSGHPRLVEILSKLYSKLINRQIDPNREIMTTLGASEGLSCAILTLVSPGDEVIVIEPYFEPYVTLIKMASGVPRFAALKKIFNKTTSSYEWYLDKHELEALFSEKVKFILLNNPNNPTGKVFSVEELEFITALCCKWNVTCISDEVYEWQVYKPKEHIRIASMPGMWERTVTIGSAGKCFSVTGWKVGWVYGSSSLMRKLQEFHEYTVFCGVTPMEEAVARILEHEFKVYGCSDNSFLMKLRKQLEIKRNFIFDTLEEARFKPVLPDAGAFLLADWSDLEPLAELSAETDEYMDFRFTKWLAKDVGILAIPATPFFSETNKKTMESYIRVCFITHFANLDEARKRLLQKFPKA